MMEPTTGLLLLAGAVSIGLIVTIASHVTKYSREAARRMDEMMRATQLAPDRPPSPERPLTATDAGLMAVHAMTRPFPRPISPPPPPPPGAYPVSHAQAWLQAAAEVSRSMGISMADATDALTRMAQADLFSAQAARRLIVLDCPVCNGRGVHRRYRRRGPTVETNCRRCGGTGTITRPLQENAPASGQTAQERKPDAPGRLVEFDDKA